MTTDRATLQEERKWQVEKFQEARRILENTDSNTYGLNESEKEIVRGRIDRNTNYLIESADRIAEINRMLATE